MSAVSGFRKRRVMVGSSVTRLINWLLALEGKSAKSSNFDIAQDMAKRLSVLDQEFRNYHYELLDFIDEGDEGALANEQRDLDKHDNVIMMQICISSNSL